MLPQAATRRRGLKVGGLIGPITSLARGSVPGMVWSGRGGMIQVAAALGPFVARDFDGDPPDGFQPTRSRACVRRSPQAPAALANAPATRASRWPAPMQLASE